MFILLSVSSFWSLYVNFTVCLTSDYLLVAICKSFLLSVSLFYYLSVYQSVCIFVSLFYYLYRSYYLYVCFAVCLSIGLFDLSNFRSSIYLWIYLFLLHLHILNNLCSSHYQSINNFLKLVQIIIIRFYITAHIRYDLE
jgi:hypothetical protein